MSNYVPHYEAIQKATYKAWMEDDMRIEQQINGDPKQQLTDNIFKELNLTQDITKAFISHLIDMAVMFDKKQSDYGSNNISDFGELGVIVRMNDKMARIKNLTKGGKTPQNESLDDSFSDISNYGVIALMVRKGEWK